LLSERCAHEAQIIYARVELENGLRRLMSKLTMIEGRSRLALEDFKGFRDVVQAAPRFTVN
jgi:hypothetical protein